MKKYLSKGFLGEDLSLEDLKSIIRGMKKKHDTKAIIFFIIGLISMIAITAAIICKLNRDKCDDDFDDDCCCDDDECCCDEEEECCCSKDSEKKHDENGCCYTDADDFEDGCEKE